MIYSWLDDVLTIVVPLGPCLSTMYHYKYIMSSLTCEIYLAIVVVFYDWFTTFDKEVRCIWKGKFTLVTLLYILNRYGVLAVCVADVLVTFGWPVNKPGPRANEVCLLPVYSSISTSYCTTESCKFMFNMIYAGWNLMTPVKL